MRYKSLFLLIPLLSVAPLLADEKQSAAMLARYPQTEAFKYMLQPSLQMMVISQVQERAADGSLLQPRYVAREPRRLLRSVCFSEGRAGTGLRCSVGTKGEVYTVRDVYNWAQQDDRRSQLNSEQLVELKELLRDMPANAVKPTLENLMVVNFIEDGKPAIRIYNRSKLPPQIVKIYKLLGASASSDLPTQTPK